MEPIIITFLANPSFYGMPSLQILSRSFGLECWYALCLAVAMSQVVAYNAAEISLLSGPRSAVLLACTLHIFGWSLLAGKWVHFGLALLGMANGCIREALIPTMHDRSKSTRRTELRLLYLVMLVVSQIPAIFNHWINQIRLSVFEPDLLTWEMACCVMALPAFLAGIISYFRLSRYPIPPREANIFVKNRVDGCDELWVWFCTILQAMASCRFAVYLSTISQTSLKMFVGQPAEAEEFAEIVWKGVVLGWIIYLPLFFLLLDKIGPILFSVITALVCMIWAGLIESESLSNGSFSLLFLPAIRPALHIMSMAVAEGFTGNCQLCERQYASMLSISGLVQLLSLLSLRWCRIGTFTFILNSGIIAVVLAMILRLATMTPATSIIEQPPQNDHKCLDDTTHGQPHSPQKVQSE